MHHGFGGEFVLTDWLILLSPLPCLGILLTAAVIRKPR